MILLIYLFLFGFFFSRPFKGVTHAPHRESRATLFGMDEKKFIMKFSIGRDLSAAAVLFLVS